jgi:hypothetical protein
MDESIKKLLIATYQQTVKSVEVSPELKTMLKAHERVPGFIANLEREIALMQKSIKPTKQELIDMCRDLTVMFCKNIELKANQMMMSDAEKSRLKTEAEAADIIRKAADTGVLTEETIDVLKQEDPTITA